MGTTLTDNFCRSCGGSTGETVADHEAKADPHSQYLTQAEGDALYESSGGGSSAVAAHEADTGDPHSAAGYLKSADLSSYATTAYVDGEISTHEGAADPHPNYALEAFTEDRTGWGHYLDTAVTSGAPLTLVASTPTDLPNAANTKIEGELPDDVTEFYETTGSTIVVGSIPDLLEVQVELTVEPTVVDQWLDVWIEDGAATVLGRQTFSLVKGAVAHSIVYRFALKGTTNLVANGGKVRVESADTPDIYDISYLISRKHKTRTT